MTMLIECKDLCKEYRDNNILYNINLKINLGEKIGIVGSNGCGKTTLANLIIKDIEPTSGSVIYYKNGINIGYMKQNCADDNIKNTLSGGEKTKIKLKRVLYGNYNVLLLDEPTNNLDYEGVKWLINEVKKFKGTVIIISHDRYFLDQSINKIIEIDNHKTNIYNGNYSWYREEKKRIFNNTVHRYYEQEKIKNKINNQVIELRKWSNKAHKDSAKKAIETGNKFGGKEFNRAKAKRMDKAIKSKIKRLEKIKLDGIEKPVDEKPILFEINKANKIGSKVVIAEEINKRYDDKIVFENSSFYIKQGEKVGIYGPNGCGKSTLIKCLIGETTISGNLYISPSNNIGYISQDSIDLNDNLTILEHFDFSNRTHLGELRSKLNLLGFDTESLSKQVKVLSLGERMKLKILMMIEKQCDLLILDEPTNHIDLHVREQLEETLKEYNGTIILVTHDRYMLQRICNKLLVFDNKKIKRYECNFTEYLCKKENKTSNKKREEEKMILDNKITCILSQLCGNNKGTETYVKLEEEYNKLLKLKSSYL